MDLNKIIETASKIQFRALMIQAAERKVDNIQSSPYYATFGTDQEKLNDLKPVNRIIDSLENSLKSEFNTLQKLIES